MANSKSNTRSFINLDGFGGTGEVGRYKEEIVGILLGIEPREGTYQVTDRRTGEVITRPNSWTAYFEDGSMWSWPTYVDQETGQVKPWSRFDPSIKLASVVKQRQVIHVWKDNKGFAHLELAHEQEVATPLPATCPFDVE